jgi:uncharacterized protein
VTDDVPTGHLLTESGRTFHPATGLTTEPHEPCGCAQAKTEPVFQIRSYREAVPQLQLSLTGACNMGCSYCSFRDRVHTDGKSVSMPVVTARQAAQSFADYVKQREQAYARVDFGLAGETMLMESLHESIHAAVEDSLAQSGVSMAWSGPNVTNGSLHLLEDRADLLGAPQDISLDGPQATHDRVRSYVNGRGGTYADVRSVLSRVLEREPMMGVSAVITAYNTDLVEIFEHLYGDLGVRNIYMKPVNLAHTSPMALSRESLGAFMDGYTGLVNHFKSLPPSEMLSRLLALNSEDYFMRFVHRVKDRSVSMYRCGVGKSGRYVDTNGLLYGCAHFMGKPGYSIGNIRDGVDPGVVEKFESAHVDNRPQCSDCFAKYVCGGGCHYQAVLATGDPFDPDPVKCDLIRHLTTLAVNLVEWLQEDAPQVYSALPQPFGLPASLLNAPPDTPFRPLHRTRPAQDNERLLLATRDRLRGGLGDRAQAHMKVSIDDDNVALEVQAPAECQIEIWWEPTGKRTLEDLAARVLHSGRIQVDSDGAVEEHAPGWYQRVPYSKTDSSEYTNAERLRDGPNSWLIRLPHTNDPEAQFNVRIIYPDGGWTALVLYEPFVTIDCRDRGPAKLTGPEVADTPYALVGGWPPALIPFGRYAGIQPNTC